MTQKVSKMFLCIFKISHPSTVVQENFGYKIRRPQNISTPRFGTQLKEYEMVLGPLLSQFLENQFCGSQVVIIP
jgi:hypothetical protein